MTQKRSKNHHFIPRTLQRPFCFEPERVWYSERIADGKFEQPEARNLSSVFSQRDYYTIIRDGQLTDAVEKGFYERIDDFIGKFLKETSEIFDRGTVPVVEGASLSSLRSVVFHMLKRNPEFTKQYNDLDIGREIEQSVLQSLENEAAHPSEIEESRQLLSDPIKMKHFGRHVRVLAQTSPSSEVLDAMSDFVCRWGIAEGKHSFVLSSTAIYRIGNGGSNGVANTNMEFWLPVSPKRVLILVRDKENKIPRLSTVDRDWVRRVNEYGVRNSNSIISHSAELLRSLTGNR